MTKMSSIIFLTFLMITATFGVDATEPSEVIDTILDQPICILENYNDTAQQQFKEFAKYEDCQFHLFMDVLQEIDCYLIHKHSPPDYNCENEECMNAVFQMREEIYSYRIDNNCKCNQSRDAPESNNQNLFLSSSEDNYFSAELDERVDTTDATIHTLCDYINCWVELWQNMHAVVKKKLSEIRTNPAIVECEKIGQANNKCSSHITPPPKCTNPTI